MAMSSECGVRGSRKKSLFLATYYTCVCVLCFLCKMMSSSIITPPCKLSLVIGWIWSFSSSSLPSSWWLPAIYRVELVFLERTFSRVVVVRCCESYTLSKKEYLWATQRASCLKSGHLTHNTSEGDFSCIRGLSHSVIIRPSKGSKVLAASLLNFCEKRKKEEFKVANEVESKVPVVDQLDKNLVNKMTASPQPALASWAPILFPPWNLPAAFYPAALRSLPKWVKFKRRKNLKITSRCAKSLFGSIPITMQTLWDFPLF